MLHPTSASTPSIPTAHIKMPKREERTQYGITKYAHDPTQEVSLSANDDHRESQLPEKRPVLLGERSSQRISNKRQKDSRNHVWGKIDSGIKGLQKFGTPKSTPKSTPNSTPESMLKSTLNSMLKSTPQGLGKEIVPQSSDSKQVEAPFQKSKALKSSSLLSPNEGVKRKVQDTSLDVVTPSKRARNSQRPHSAQGKREPTANSSKRQEETIANMVGSQTARPAIRRKKKPTLGSHLSQQETDNSPADTR